MVTMIKIKTACAVALIWMAITTAVALIPGVSPWIATPFVLIGLVFVIGTLFAINLTITPGEPAEYALYSIGLGLAFLVIGGLALNWALPYFGVSSPLAPVPLMIFFDAIAVVLCLRAYVNKKDGVVPYSMQRINGVNIAFGIIPWIFILFSICGAALLNNGGNGAVTIAMIFGIAVYVLVLVARRAHVDGWVYISALFSIALSMLFMFSLRTPHVLGWDINQEYQVFQMTLQNLRWKMSYYPGLDYNACISLTILPTIFAVLTHIPSEYVYKVTFQLLFAIIPVTVYVLARRYINKTLAFLAAFLLLAQTWFFEQMPMLIRQEIAFIFYAVMIVAIFDKKLSERTRYILFTIFAVALILSHYSTAYVLVGLMLITLVLTYGVRFFIPAFQKKSMPITIPMFLTALLFLYIWQVPLTHISGTVTTVATYVSKAPIAAALPSQPRGTSTSSEPPAPPTAANNFKSIAENAFSTILFSGNAPSTDQDLITAEGNALTVYIPQIAGDTYPASDTASYAPIIINENSQIPSKLPGVLSSTINVIVLATKILFIDIFPLIGIAGIYLALRRRATAMATYDFILLNIAAFLLVASVVFLPNLQEFYSLTRLYLQMFITLSIVAMMGGIMVTNRFPRYQTMILTVMIVLMFVSFNGAIDQFTGGQARLTLDQPPSTFDAYIIHQPEIAGAQWLAAHRNPILPVQADDVASLRLESFANISTGAPPIFPQIIERNSYVYLIEDNVLQQEAFYIYNSNLLEYNYPLEFLDSNKNLIYNNGGSRIYQ